MIRNLFVLFVVALLTACGGSSDKPKAETKAVEAKQDDTKAEDAKAETALEADRKTVKAVHDQMAEIENQFLKGQDELIKTLNKISKKNKQPTPEETTKIQEKLVSLGHILDRSKTLDVPKITNSGAAIMITNALNTHKQWSKTQGAKLVAVINGDAESAKKYAAGADVLAVKEALAMDMAFKEVGLE